MLNSLMKTCKRCRETKLATREFFGSVKSSGNLRGTCRECERIQSREFEKNNKDKRRARDAKRATATTGGNRKGFDLDAKRALFEKQGGVCLLCAQRIESAEVGQVDHLIPLAKGGRDDKSNLALAHAQCNKEKHNKTILEHWEWRVAVRLDPENIGRKY